MINWNIFTLQPIMQPLGQRKSLWRHGTKKCKNMLNRWSLWCCVQTWILGFVLPFRAWLTRWKPFNMCSLPWWWCWRSLLQLSHIQIAHCWQYVLFQCRIRKWLLAWLTNFVLRLGKIVKVDELIRRWFWALPLHICIKLCERVIFVFIFIIRFWYLKHGVDQNPIS